VSLAYIRPDAPGCWGRCPCRGPVKADHKLEGVLHRFWSGWRRRSGQLNMGSAAIAMAQGEAAVVPCADPNAFCDTLFEPGLPPQRLTQRALQHAPSVRHAKLRSASRRSRQKSRSLREAVQWERLPAWVWLTLGVMVLLSGYAIGSVGVRLSQARMPSNGVHQSAARLPNSNDVASALPWREAGAGASPRAHRALPNATEVASVVTTSAVAGGLAVVGGASVPASSLPSTAFTPPNAGDADQPLPVPLARELRDPAAAQRRAAQAAPAAAAP
jgi:hypothetical protein